MTWDTIKIILICVGLFGATAATDWLATRWTDAVTPKQRGWLAAVHELVNLIAGFTVFTIFQSVWMVIPCVLGAGIGSYFGGVNRPPDSLDADLVAACSQCGEPFLAFTSKSEMCPRCSYIAVERAERKEVVTGYRLIPPEDHMFPGVPIEVDENDD